MAHHRDLLVVHPLRRQTQSVILDTDPETFVVSHTFDLGHVTFAEAKVTVLQINPDGETFGTTPDVNLVVDVRSIETSRDGLSWSYLRVADYWFHDQVPPVIAEGQVSFEGTFIVARYLRYFEARIAVLGDISTYAGANHPTAQVQIDVSYI